ncbi:ABC transporter substrate-binding protein [Halostella litorea]|uniref:ABC transporter substrate-binding protein n=1 Tax=Halostella litorea TaxID=2528831 RepID=UPI001092570C|nr:ABC transporter substrate-binding protein [Halostella litorea]
MKDHNRRSFLKRAGAASAVSIGGLAGCTGGGDDGDGVGDEIVIACPTALSGAFAPYGEAERDGGRLAAQHLEEEFDVSIEVVTGDSAANPDEAVSQIEGMVVDDGAHMAFGGVSSAVGMAMGSWATENQVPICVHGGSDDITGSQCAEYMFSTYMSNTMQLGPVAPAMADLEDDWYILYSDYTWGQTAFDAYSQALESEGANVVGSQAVPFPTQEYNPYLNSAEESDAGGIALLVAGLDQRASTSQILSREMQDDYSFMMHQTEDVSLWGIDPRATALLDINSQGWSAGLDVSEDWLEEIAELSDHDPFVRHYMGYVSVDQMVRASMRAESLEGEAIKDELSGHEVDNDAIYDLQPTEETIYWREGDHQLVQPTHMTSGRAVSEHQNDPYNVWFDVERTMEGEEASPEPSGACEL